jgi:hypothetical protein
MNHLTRIAAAALAGLACLAAQAQTDPCTQLAGKSQCFTFTYGDGNINSYTAAFGSDGSSFTFPDVSGTTGTYSCYGSGLTNVSYAYAGVEQQSWYATAGKKGKTLRGHGREGNGYYMYSFSSTPGACTVEAGRTPGHRQNR